MDAFQDLDDIFSEHFGNLTLRNENVPLHSEEETPSSLVTENFVNQEDEGSNTDERDVRIIHDFLHMIEADHVEIDRPAETDDEYLSLKSKFLNGCKCSKSCLNNFDVDDIYSHILNLKELTKDEKDMHIMGCLFPSINNTENTRLGKRQRLQYTYQHKNVKICRGAFEIINSIGDTALKNIMKHCNENGISPRTHGNTGKKPKHALTYEDIERAVKFIKNIADEIGLPHPAAPRGRDDTPPIFLPSSTTKKEIHEKYSKTCEEIGVRSVKHSTFLDLWTKCCPNIKIANPRDDVCVTCERSRKKITDAITENDKLQAISEFHNHIIAAQNEREVYTTCIKNATEEFHKLLSNPDIIQPFPSELKHVHYTFDFSQSVNLPHHSRQMGPVYFTTPRKIHIFGFRIDGTPEQLNFLIDESQTIGYDGKECHGPNSVISMVDYALTNHSFCEHECSLHADNCGGQNKNKYLLAYFAWRIICGFHKKIRYMMQIPGHTRCLVNAGFANAKRLFRRSDCESLTQLRDIVNKSCKSNKSVLYVNERGVNTWEWRDWKSFLARHFKALKGIQKYQHFRFDLSSPGIVFLKDQSEGTEKQVNLLKDCSATFDGTRPPTLSAAGLSEERSLYLYRQVRPFVRPGFQDEICPLPASYATEE